MPAARLPTRTAGVCALFTGFAVRSAAGRPPRERAKLRANAGRQQATPSDARRLSSLVKSPLSDTENMTGGQGVAGSNPAVPTGNRAFSNILPLRKSQQKSQLVVQRPLHRPAPRACPA